MASMISSKMTGIASCLAIGGAMVATASLEADALAQVVTEVEIGGPRSDGTPCLEQRYPKFLPHVGGENLLVWEESRFPFSNVAIGNVNNEGIVEHQISVGATYVAEPAVASYGNRLIVALLNRGLQIVVLEVREGTVRVLGSRVLVSDGLPAAGVVGELIAVAATRHGYIVAFPRNDKLEVRRLDRDGLSVGEPQVLADRVTPRLLATSDDSVLLLHASSGGLQRWQSQGHDSFEQQELLPIYPWDLQLVSAGQTVELIWGEREQSGPTNIFRAPLADVTNPVLLRTVPDRLVDLAVSRDGLFAGYTAQRTDRTVYTAVAQIDGTRLTEIDVDDGRHALGQTAIKLSDDIRLLASSIHDQVFGSTLFFDLIDARGRISRFRPATDMNCRLKPRFLTLDDRVAVAWLERNQAGTTEVLGQMLQVSGDPTGPRLELTGPKVDSPIFATMMGNDWLSSLHYQAADGASLELRHSDNSSTTANVSAGLVPRQRAPVSSSIQDASLVVWVSDEAGERKVLGSLFNGRGQFERTFEIAELRTSAFRSVAQPALHHNGDRWLVVWQDLAPGAAPDSDQSLWAAWIETSGEVGPAGKLVNAVSSVADLWLATSPEGSLLMWRGFQDGSLVADIDGLRLDATGQPLGTPFRLSEHPTELAILADDHGGFDVVWAGGGGLRGFRLSLAQDRDATWQVLLQGSIEDLQPIGRSSDRLFVGASRTPGSLGRSVSLRTISIDFSPTVVADGGVGDSIGLSDAEGGTPILSDGCGCHTHDAQPDAGTFLAGLVVLARVRRHTRRLRIEDSRS